ncbi:CPBP family glutamic-type intramembrane protease [Sorangium sp. So ce1000]|uniref:CPBP family glutamic-type intramembrane protease n=1 Tax=Sorangium sp. So ce1000 TaxID=3133325 RepID=UPI003F63CE68
MVSRILLLAVLLVAYYAFLMARFGRLSERLVLRSGLSENGSWLAANDAYKLGLSAFSQSLLLVVLMLVTGVTFGRLFPEVSLYRLLYGVLLGAGEMALTALLVHVVLLVLIARGGEGIPSSIEGWLPLSRGGWMREYANTSAVAPWPFVVAATIGYVSVEEMIFRGVLLSFLSADGVVVAFVASLASFVGVQVLHTPSWRTALFPVIGALVVGSIHAALFLVVPDMTPLIVAHITFFVIATI